ncbi:nucleotidyltransferase domain-containing protein [Pseudanabaena sp. FACHB-2040]|uniref:type VII toxin-antitoxin system MntA family adenylyltransferase antitoxin n=1 Tax=Pseudanabaena sp. FACHB-2040 TaxID=2692859 RepID=UPI0016832FB2|nr:nucleotidyltransferase domain-containing protein [Pseudanabaena sp. FACHB-2040]
MTSSLPLVDLSSRLPQVRLLVLFGSRAKGTATEGSDWDLGVGLSDPDLDGWSLLALAVPLAEVLGIQSEQIDLVNLDRCSPLLGFAMATEGMPLYEEIPGLFHCFQVKAAKVYADTAKLRQAQEQYIARMLKQLKQ